MTAIMTVADLPESMRAPAEASRPSIPTPARVRVLTCEHGPACPSCVLAAARVIVEADATLAGKVYTG
jgi:hypothetical protein